jgi:hypothetical protein
MQGDKLSILSTATCRVILSLILMLLSLLANMRLGFSFYTFYNFANLRIADFSKRIIIRYILQLMLLSLLSKTCILIICGSSRQIIIIQSGNYVILMFPYICWPLGSLLFFLHNFNFVLIVSEFILLFGFDLFFIIWLLNRRLLKCFTWGGNNWRIWLWRGFLYGRKDF